MFYSGKIQITWWWFWRYPQFSGKLPCFHIFFFIYIFSYSDSIWCDSDCPSQFRSSQSGRFPTAFANAPLWFRRWPVAPCAALRALRRRIFAMSAMTWEPPQIENSRTLLSHLFKHWSIEIHFLFEGRMRATWSLTLGLTNRKNEMRGTSAKRTWVLCFSDFIKKTKL